MKFGRGFGLSGMVLLSVVLSARDAGAELCPACAEKMFIMNIGVCVECGEATRSGAFRLCPKCSTALRQCEHCRIPLQSDGDEQGGSPSDQSVSVILSLNHAGRTARIRVGELFRVELSGNPSTGFEWMKPEKSSRSIFRQLSVTYSPSKGAGIRVGAGGTYRFVFRAVKPGKELLELVYRRRWEKKKPPLKQFSATIEVRGTDRDAIQEE